MPRKRPTAAPRTTKSAAQGGASSGTGPAAPGLTGGLDPAEEAADFLRPHPLERLVEVEVHVTAWRALLEFKHLTPSLCRAIEAAVRGGGGYVSLRMAEVDAEFLEGDWSHEIVHGRCGARKANLFGEAAQALEVASSKRSSYVDRWHDACESRRICIRARGRNGVFHRRTRRALMRNSDLCNSTKRGIVSPWQARFGERLLVPQTARDTRPTAPPRTA